MDPSPSKCPACGGPFTEVVGERCPNCGAVLEPATERPLWRLYFWLVFLGTPALALGTAMVGPLVMRLMPRGFPVPFRAATPLGIVFLGAAISAYLLARAHSKTARSARDVIGLTIGYTVGLVIVYAAIAFVGCLVVVGIASH